jgi:hypothetical protein
MVQFSLFFLFPTLSFVMVVLGTTIHEFVGER